MAVDAAKQGFARSGEAGANSLVPELQPYGFAGGSNGGMAPKNRPNTVQ